MVDWDVNPFAVAGVGDRGLEMADGRLHFAGGGVGDGGDGH